MKWSLRHRDLIRSIMLCLIYILGIYLLITKMIQLENNTNADTGTRKNVTLKELTDTAKNHNKKAVQYVSSSMIKEAPQIAITFDDGPSKAWTGKLLDGLKERNVKATFFLIGENVKSAPEIVKREAD